MEATEQTPSAETSTIPVPVVESVQNGTLLCQINGKPWHYTKASGLITADRKTGARTALITFTKKLEKGSESIQLYYNAETYELQKANAQLKFPKAGGGRFGGIYELSDLPHTQKVPGNSKAGTIDLSDPKAASGTANVINAGVLYEKEQLANAEDAVVSLTDLRFAGIGYSDLAKEKAKLGY
jgi:hypothetical protein